MQRSFAVGEVAPALYARTDQARYEVALRICRNFMVMRQGGATKRPGTEYLTEVKDSANKVRLIPFVFNVRQTFVLEFGAGYVRFITNGGVVMDPDDDSIPYEIESPYAVGDLPTLAYVQSGDVITLTHPSYAPYELIRVSNTNWTLNAIVFGPLDTAIISSVTGGDPATTGDYAYVVTGITDAGEETLGSTPFPFTHPPNASNPTFIDAIAGATVTTWNLYRRDSANGVYGFIVSGIGPFVSFADFGIIPEPALQPPISKTPFVGADNYPSISTYYQQRQIFANTNNNPDTVWASRSGLYKNFNISAITQDDDAIQFRLVSDEVDAVRQLVNLGDLIVGTEGTLWDIQGDGNGTLTPIAINPRAAAYGGVGPIRPIKSGARMLYQQALGSAVRELTASNTNGFNNLAGGDATLFSSHLFDGYTITDWAFQQEPLHVLWVVRSDGRMLGLTYIPEQEMLAWHRHDTLGFVENVCVVPEGRAHWLYVVVRRLIDGEYRRYIERMTTSNVLPVFATPEEAALAPGGIVTPPPPPPPPPPSTTPISPPTNASTTDVTTTGGTANWIAGNTTGSTSVEIRQIGTTPWTATIIGGAITSHAFTGLTSDTVYEWRAAHVIGTTYSDYLGPSGATQFGTGFVTTTLTDPASAPVITTQAHASGLTTLTITWPAAPIVGEVSRLQIAGPTDLTPTDGEFSDIGVFATGVGTALWTVTVTGTYWLRVRYEQTDFTSSSYVDDAGTAITVS